MVATKLNKISSNIYRIGRISRDIIAIVRFVETGSIYPLFRRVINKWLGRNLGRYARV